jgi:excisionase family DNA binding protein
MNRDEVSDPRQSPKDLFDQPAPVAIRHVPVRRQKIAPKEIPFMQRPTCTIKEACKAAGMGRTKFYELIKGGELKITPVGRRRLVQVPSLLKFLKIEVDDQALRNHTR